MRAPRILLVDDDAMVLRALRRLLLGTRPAWEIDMAESAEAAFTLLDGRSYDVLVTDLHMPGVDGVSLLIRLKLEHASIVRVVHSSHVESLSGEQVRELAHAVLNKPAPPEELVQLLETAVAERRKQVRDSVGS
jgi:DNA-binding NtrC family response regulator